MDGGLGLDLLVGGTGDDVYLVDTLADVVVENADEGTDTVKSAVTWTLSANFENLTLLVWRVLLGLGMPWPIFFWAMAGATTWSGLDGDDRIFAAVGNDTLDGGVGAVWSAARAMTPMSSTACRMW